MLLHGIVLIFYSALFFIHTLEGLGWPLPKIWEGTTIILKNIQCKLGIARAYNLKTKEKTTEQLNTCLYTEIIVYIQCN